ncbi:MAG: hypothetical protein NTU98_08125 [Bacteroidetes bacterium]|nr:hypothetical protein [Bacteroidota bacterium]
MEKIIIDYLREEDREGLAYKAVRKELEDSNTKEADNRLGLLMILQELKTNDDDLLLTFLSHGFSGGITKGDNETLITWMDLCTAVNSIKTTYSVTLNLLAICNSFHIEQYRSIFGKNIKKIWITNSCVISINKSLLAMKHGDFKTFYSNLAEEEIDLYREI